MVWANAEDEPVASLDLIGTSHDCQLYSLLVCCLSELCHCWCSLCSSCRHFNRTTADIQKPVVSNSSNWLVS